VNVSDGFLHPSNRHQPEIDGESTIYDTIDGLFNKFWLVVLTILKNMKVNGKDYPIHYGKKMFETTSQIWFKLVQYTPGYATKLYIYHYNNMVG